MSVIRKRLRPRASRDEGYSLTELLVVIGLFAVVGTIVMQGVVTGLQHTRRVQARTEALVELERATERMSREIRGACPLETLASDDVVVRTQQPTGVVRYRYYLDGSGNLVESQQLRDPVSGAWGTPTERTLVERVLNTPQGLVTFSYHDETGAVTGNAGAVRRVDMLLRRDLPETTALTIETSIQLRNGGTPCDL